MTEPAPDFLPLDAIAKLQAERWTAQRAYVEAHSPFLQRLWGGRTPPERLEDLPALPLSDKAMLRESQTAHAPFGDYLAAPETGVARLHRTSGTSGQAMNLALSARDAAQTVEVGGRAQRAAGLGPGQRVVHCLNYRLWMGGLTDHLTLEATGATVIPFGVGESELLIRTIRELGATAISCTPSYPAVLERVIAERFAGLRPRDLGLELGLFGERFDAGQALEMGLAWKVVPEAQLVAEAQGTARRIAALPGHAVGALKHVLARAPGRDLEAAMALETEATLRGFLDPETAEIIARFGTE